MSQFMTVQEACRYLGVSRTTLLKTESEGLITSVRTVGGHRRYMRETLDQYLRATTGLQTRAVTVPQDLLRPASLPSILERVACSPAPLEDTLRETLLDLVRVLQADVAFLALLDEQRNLWPRLHVGPAGRTPGGPPQPLADAISTKVLDARRPLAYDGGDVFGLEEATEGICAPLLYRGNLLGVVHVLSLSRHQFLPIEVSFLSVVAVQLAGLIVDNEQLVESQGRADALAFLNRLNSAMQGQSDPDGVARVLLAEARQRSAAQGGGVWLWNEAERGYLAAVHGLPSDSAMSLHSEMEALLTRALDSETGYLLVPSSDPCGQNDAPRLLKGVGSVLVLPLRSPESL